MGSRSIYISFTQHGCPNILEKINEKFDNTGFMNSSNEGQLLFNGQNCLPIIKRIEPYLIEKKKQINLITEHLKLIQNRKGWKRNAEDKEIDKSLATKCRKLKHYDTTE